MKRGHETAEHLSLKKSIGEQLTKAGFGLVLFEHKCCDVVAIRQANGQQFILGIEIERSSRNCLKNVQRNFNFGCHAVLIVCPDSKTKQSIQNKLNRYGNPEHIIKTTIIHLKEETWKINCSNF